MTKLGAMATIAIGAAAGYLGGRTLMERETLPERLPAPLRERLQSAGGRLRRARETTQRLLDELEQVRRAAEQELTDDYLSRVGRGSADAQASGGGESAESPASEPPARSEQPPEAPSEDR